ncbi:transporter substrate-binding domain-containing protein [Shinella sp.]|uniref:transporter substrate-binding domain-containing protein n=1 Tax=Shinella sp. TaxID=1870904 RepID=UPI003F6EDBE1
MNALRVTVSAIVVVFLAGMARAEEVRTIKIATEGAFPPWNAVNASGEPVGFDVDVGVALCARANLKCEFVTQAWDGIIPALTVGKYDAIMAGMSITEKRKRVISFSEPYALTSNYFVVSKSLGLPAMENGMKLDLTTETDTGKRLLADLKGNLKGRSIGVQGSTNAEAFVREYFGDTVEVRTYDKQDNLNLDLVAGRIDGGLADFSVWKAFLESKDGNSTHLYGPRISGGLFGPGIAIGLRKADEALSEKFNGAIRAIAADGTLKDISLRWFGGDIVTR